MKDKESSYLEIGERKVPLKAVEKLEEILNVWVKNKEEAREKAVDQIFESMMIIEFTGGSVDWEINEVDK